VNILAMMWKNLWGGSRTVLFPARPRVTPRFRGLVRFDPTRCTGCAICKFRCTSRAIDFKGGKGEFTWSYDPGQCTFCGRCVEGCKDHAIHQESSCPPIYENIGELKVAYTVARKPPVARLTVTPIPSTKTEITPLATSSEPTAIPGGAQ
jgi:formate hydrogenlyase subunit 6/NADH:ubiquinone oxidoreductase subunit I